MAGTVSLKKYGTISGTPEIQILITQSNSPEKIFKVEFTNFADEESARQAVRVTSNNLFIALLRFTSPRGYEAEFEELLGLHTVAAEIQGSDCTFDLLEPLTKLLEATAKQVSLLPCIHFPSVEEIHSIPCENQTVTVWEKDGGLRIEFPNSIQELDDLFSSRPLCIRNQNNNKGEYLLGMFSIPPQPHRAAIYNFFRSRIATRFGGGAPRRLIEALLTFIATEVEKLTTKEKNEQTLDFLRRSRK